MSILAYHREYLSSSEFSWSAVLCASDEILFIDRLSVKPNLDKKLSSNRSSSSSDDSDIYKKYINETRIKLPTVERSIFYFSWKVYFSLIKYNRASILSHLLELVEF